MFNFTEDVWNELKATEAISEEAISALALTAQDTDIGNWSRSDFQSVKGIGPAAAFAAHTIVRKFLAAQPIEEEVRVTIPAKPPYLDRPEDYDPHDSTQFWTAETGEMYRWDGKRSPQTPWGKVRPVAVVRHITVAGVVVPDMKAAREAERAGCDWFHQSYRSWINPSGKPYSQIDRETAERVKRALNQMADRGPFLTAAQAVA